MSRLAPAASVAGVLLVLAGSLVPAQATPWDGFYIGIQAGDTWGDTTLPYGPLGGPATTSQGVLEMSSLNGGAHLGYDFGFDEFVVGALADYNATNLQDDDNSLGGDLNGVKIENIITARARGGWRFLPGSLVYATVGGAWMDGSATAPSSAVDADIFALTYGAGVEFALGRDATLGFEWRRIDSDAELVNFPIDGYSESVEPELDTIQVHLNIYFSSLFDGPGDGS